MVKFPDRLKELRLERQMSRKTLANLLQVNERTISYWELGQRECNLEQLYKIAIIFCISSDYLIGLEN